ncbi:MAG: DUF2760 domain-containing protein [Sandaracinaceae bacterium]|nr:DUF2760 domain-containing protein [Sandaracinaceae bacterium]
MSEPTLPGFFTRFFLAWAAYFRTLFDAQFAAGVIRLREGKPALPEEAPKNKKAPKRASESDESASDGDGKASEGSKKDKKPEEKKKEVVLREAGPEAALQLLALLQREGRFVDFLEEDVSSFSDAQIGAAARVVHDGCRKAIREHLPIAPVRSEDEGARVKLEKGFDAHAVRLTGNVTGEAPFTGTLAHRGWKVKEVKLPKMTEGHDATIVAPAEVEV